MLLFFAIDFAADRIHGKVARGLRSLGKAFMLLLGLTWEGAFWEGAHTMSQGMGFDDQTARMLMVVVLSLILCAIVMPAWIIHIVPHTFKEEHGELHMKDYDEHVSPASHSGTPKLYGQVSGTGSHVKGFARPKKSPKHDKSGETNPEEDLRLGCVSPTHSRQATNEENSPQLACSEPPKPAELQEVCISVDDSKSTDVPEAYLEALEENDVKLSL